jgi:hypothetical protein
MKKIAISIVAVLAIVSVSVAQNTINSSNNYKMPQVAKKAVNPNAIVAAYALEANKGLASQANYKAGNSVASDLSGAEFAILPLDINVNALANSANYKSKFGRANQVIEKAPSVQPIALN